MNYDGEKILHVVESPVLYSIIKTLRKLDVIDHIVEYTSYKAISVEGDGLIYDSDVERAIYWWDRNDR